MKKHDLWKEISIRIYSYTHQYNQEPNNIILGIEVYKELEATNDILIMHSIGTGQRKYFQGIPITVDYLEPKAIKIGYME